MARVDCSRMISAFGHVVARIVHEELCCIILQFMIQRELQQVELGQVRSSRLAKAGDLSSAVGFNIKLNDCDTNVSSNAAVAFLGTTVTSNDDTLALQSSAAGSAQNVGIQILDRTGVVLVLDGATFSAKTDLIDGTNILPFQARYIALGQSVAGTANADATFKVQYL
ncbi:type 1 fimbrial protein precursor [Escherichia coli]|nr:type 1 fimbrial protein precursor [Escherichia coli]